MFLFRTFWVNPNYYYEITYGLSKKLYKIKIVFESADFFHLAGFQYLDDLQFPTVSRHKTIDAILDGRINGVYIKNGKKYFSFVESRLIALINLEFALDNEFKIFRYNASVYPFHTVIKADYLIDGHTEDGSLFFFTVRIGESYNGASIFMERDKNFSINQKSLSILKKEKINITTNEKIIFLDKLSEQKSLKRDCNNNQLT